MNICRKKTRVIKVGNLKIGGNNPIAVQSMTKCKIENLNQIKKEITSLIEGGCELIRIAVPDQKALSYLRSLKESGIFTIPLVADIQFDYNLAISCLDIGADGVRINPGNIGGIRRALQVVEKAKQKNAVIRIGVNCGSIDKKMLRKNEGNMANAMVDSVLETVRAFEAANFYNFKVSAKASSVMDAVSIYEILSKKIDYPLHLGITEAGPKFRGSIKSSVGIGILLSRGIGDTIRVSLTDKSIEEVKAAYTILNSLNLRSFGVDIISCPTCGRTRVDLGSIVEEIEKLTLNIKKNLKLAIMGCVVNGPGEAKDADLGIAFGKDKGAIFVKGKITKRVSREKILGEFKKELEKMV